MKGGLGASAVLLLTACRASAPPASPSGSVAPLELSISDRGIFFNDRFLEELSLHEQCHALSPEQCERFHRLVATSCRAGELCSHFDRLQESATLHDCARHVASTVDAWVREHLFSPRISLLEPGRVHMTFVRESLEFQVSYRFWAARQTSQVSLYQIKAGRPSNELDPAVVTLEQPLILASVACP